MVEISRLCGVDGSLSTTLWVEEEGKVGELRAERDGLAWLLSGGEPSGDGEPCGCLELLLFAPYGSIECGGGREGVLPPGGVGAG